MEHFNVGVNPTKYRATAATFAFILILYSLIHALPIQRDTLPSRHRIDRSPIMS